MKLFHESHLGVDMTVELTYIGPDIIILLSGGDVPHIGTVTTWSKKEQKMTTIQFPSHSGRYHKDHVLAEIFIARLQSAALGNIVVSSGVHVNGINSDQIQACVQLAEQLSLEIKQWVEANSAIFQEPIYKK